MTRLLLLLALCLLVRVVALNADPPPWLSWSMALDTDEGFYTLDARHEVLFGTPAPGDFHDRLLSPLLSVLQQSVFSIFGPGLIPARLLSVTFGLLTVAVFWLGLRFAYDDTTASWGALLLGLSPPVALYSRLALQETPTAFWLVLAFTLWAVGRRATGQQQPALLLLSGIALAAAVMFKALALLALPAFLLAWNSPSPDLPQDFPPQAPLPFRRGRGGRRPGWGLLGFVLAVGLYVLLWTLPHHAELARMSAFYWHTQYAPHSWHRLMFNIRQGLIGRERGLLPYLLILMPVPCLLALGSIRRHTHPAPPLLGVGAAVFVVWLLCGVLFCLLSSYAPDRYYVLFYPALAGLAALGAARLNRHGQAAALTLFVGTSGFWYARAWTGRTFARQTAAMTLAKTLPPGSLLIGETAPALCSGTTFRAAPVQPELSNDDRPVEQLGADYALVTRTPGSQAWWQAHDPGVVDPARRVLTLSLGGRWNTVVDVYAVRKKTP